MDLTVYMFMFPVCIAIATVAMLSGISGAAMLSPAIALFRQPDEELRPGTQDPKPRRHRRFPRSCASRRRSRSLLSSGSRPASA